LAFACLSAVIAGTGVDRAHAQHGPTAVDYRVSFPEPQHHWMQVEATFPSVEAATLELRMSRSSPGRYSLHDFAKNVYDVHAFARDNRELETTRPDPYGWNVTAHGGKVTVKYKVFGDRIDGTYRPWTTRTLTSTCRRLHVGARLEDRPITVFWNSRPVPTGPSPRSCTQWQRLRPTCNTSWTVPSSSARSRCASSPRTVAGSASRCTTRVRTKSSTRS
jgi:hypothetical protein